MAKDHYAASITYSLQSPAAIILAVAIVWQFLKNLLNMDEIHQTSQLEGIDASAYPKSF